MPDVTGDVAGDQIIPGDQISPSDSDDGQTVQIQAVRVLVLLDGEASPSTLVMQGGNPTQWTTDDEGIVDIDVDLGVKGDLFVMASHQEARIRGKDILPETTEITIDLTRFDTSDNEDYILKDPGVPGESHVIEKCAHCHLTVADTWYDSAHRDSAKNPVLHDIYSGTAQAFNSEELCTQRGGSWVAGIEPGTRAEIMHCQVSTTVVGLTELSNPGTNGNCADCHAPGIDGKMGQRDLLEAEGFGYEYGVHCEVCHHVESIDLAGGPGVSGALRIVRPSELAPYPGMGEFFPLTFCPDHDVANLYMGCVQRDHFRESTLCASCHEYQQASLVPEEPADATRWPGEKFPVHSTYTEWGVSNFAAVMTCQDCHMPPAADEVTNSADLQFFGEDFMGVVGGWERPPGSVRQHTWSGPKSPEAAKLSNPLSLAIEKTTASGQVTAAVTVTNGGAAHAMPTGEPLRSLVVWVRAHCGEDELSATGGHAIPDFGGLVASKSAQEDWNQWEKAAPGMIVAVISRSGDFHDYEGFGPFGDGSFNAEQKGMPVEEVVGFATVDSVTDGQVTFDGALPSGDHAYLLNSVPSEEGSIPSTLAGHAGFAFARVLSAPSGARMVPHFLANDVASDNRIGSQKSWTSNHVFASSCGEPTITATLISRAYPYWLAQERGWDMRDKVMTELTE